MSPWIWVPAGLVAFAILCDWAVICLKYGTSVGILRFIILGRARVKRMAIEADVLLDGKAAMPMVAEGLRLNREEVVRGVRAIVKWKKGKHFLETRRSGLVSVFRKGFIKDEEGRRRSVIRFEKWRPPGKGRRAER